MQQVRCSQSFLALFVFACAGTQCAAQQDAPAGGADLRSQRADFQAQEIITGQSQSWILNAGQTPRLIWRDGDRVRELGFTDPLRVRWFDGRLEEADAPAEPGRWAAWIEGTAPNGTPFRRAKTFYVIPPQPVFFPPEVTVSLPDLPDTPDGRIWKEHVEEFNRVAKDALGRAMLNDEMSAILLAGLAEAEPLDRPARFVDSTDVRNQDFHLALKLKLLGLADQTRPLAPPRRRNSPALVLREGTSAEAGVAPNAAERIHELCQAWVDDTQEPFVTLVARQGVIVLHRAYGNDSAGTPIDLSYRCWVASITKTVTAMMFARFVDQGLVDLDDSLATVFPDYPMNDPHVPTFRQCMNHTSGLAGSPDA